MERFSKKQIVLFLICWVAYVSTYICRLNYSAIMPEMINAFGVLEDARLKLAAIGSAFFITYGVAQIFSGFIGDKLPAHWMVFSGLTLSGLLNIAMGFSSQSITGMTIIWAINGLAQSFIWSPLLKLGGEYFENKKKEKFGLYMSTTVPVGTIVAYLFTILFINLFAWNYAFMACGVATILVAIGWILFTTLYLPKYEKSEEAIQLANNIKDNKDNKTAKPVNSGWKLCIFTMLICLFPIMIHGALKDGVSQFGPTYLADNFGISTTFSIALTMILPVVNVTGAFIAKWVNKYIKNELITSLIFFVVSLGAILLLYFFADVHIALTIILLAIVTNSMFAINVMMIYLIPLKFSKYGKTSTMSGILNAIAYIGTSISMVTIGALSTGGAWTNVYYFWFGIAAAAIGICAALFIVWKKIDNKITQKDE